MREIFAALELSRKPGVGAKKFKQLINKYKLPSIALSKWLENGKIEERFSRQASIKADVEEQIAITKQQIASQKIFASFYGDEAYPMGLSDLTEPPPVLLFANKPSKSEAKIAAIVGARKASDIACDLTDKVVGALVAQGYSIVSGGARGIDSIAHKASILRGATTLSVLGCGIDVVYPPENSSLFAEIRQNNGNILTEFLCGTKPHRSFFPTRNRIIAGLAELIVIIQASEKSGSMITAKWGKKLGRDVLTIPPQTDDNSIWGGNLKLLNEGAKAFCFA